MTQEKPEIANFFKRFIDDTRKITLLSIAIAFAMTLLGFCLNRVEQSYVFISCAILWGSSLIALAIQDKKSDSNSDS